MRPFLLLALLAHCGPPFPGHCDTRTVDGSNKNVCQYWYGKNTGDFQKHCTGTLKGTYAAGTCPTAGVVGTCDSDQLFGLRLTVSYYDSGFTTDTAKAACDASAGCKQSTCSFAAAP